jgi:hypothetical protein
VKQFAREAVRDVLRQFGVQECRRAKPADPTEEVFLLPPECFAAADAHALTIALMEVLPHTKVWVVAESTQWDSETL